MSQQKPLQPPEQAPAAQPLQSALPDAKAQDAVQNQHHKEHLARLFRHADQNPQGLYLHTLITRYREIDTP